MESKLRLQHADNMRTCSKLQTSLLSCISLGLLLASLAASDVRSTAAENQAPQGYYRFPTIYGETVVFTVEGDLWRVPVQGGMAQRLTSHLGTESHAAFSPDGKFLFTANGPSDDVSVVDLATDKEIARVKSPGSPWGIVAVPDAK